MLSVAIKDEAKGCEIIRWPLAITSSGREMNAMTTERLAFQIRQCQGCGEEYHPQTQWQKYCSKKCKDHDQRLKQSYTCQGCGKAFYPRAIDRTKYCSRECAYAHTDQWSHLIKKHGQREFGNHCPVYFLKCRICGKSFTSRRNLKAPTCSRVCKLAINRWDNVQRNNQKKIALNRIYKCKWCGKEFKPEYRNKRRIFCSETCDKQSERFNSYKYKSSVGRKLYQGKLRECNKEMKYKVNYLRLLTKIYERDKGICQLCFKKVLFNDKLPMRERPVLDHIIPLSKDGEHKESNLQLTHWHCNSSKGNHVKNQQLRLL